MVRQAATSWTLLHVRSQCMPTLAILDARAHYKGAQCARALSAHHRLLRMPRLPR